jgi:hypothetical protein
MWDARKIMAGNLSEICWLSLGRAAGFVEEARF